MGEHDCVWTIEPAPGRADVVGMANRRQKLAPAADRRNLDAVLDRALEATFPASDPVAVGGTTATEEPARPIDRRAPVIDAEAIERARAFPPREPSRT
jgi:hypothetical protein